VQVTSKPLFHYYKSISFRISSGTTSYSINSLNRIHKQQTNLTKAKFCLKRNRNVDVGTAQFVLLAFGSHFEFKPLSQAATRMGGIWSRMTSWARSGEPFNICMVGLDAAGKTTILYKMKLGEVITTIPTIGLNVETVMYKGMKMNTFDVGGRNRIGPLVRLLFELAEAYAYYLLAETLLPRNKRSGVLFGQFRPRQNRRCQT